VIPLVLNILDTVETSLAKSLLTASGSSLYLVLSSYRLDLGYIRSLKPDFDTLADIYKCTIQEVYFLALATYLEMSADTIPQVLIDKLDELLINHIL
jgi:hypothetical protein